jgi:hypothetical protein
VGVCGCQKQGSQTASRIENGNGLGDKEHTSTGCLLPLFQNAKPVYTTRNFEKIYANSGDGRQRANRLPPRPSNQKSRVSDYISPNTVDRIWRRHIQDLHPSCTSGCSWFVVIVQQWCFLNCRMLAISPLSTLIAVHG